MKKDDEYTIKYKDYLMYEKNYSEHTVINYLSDIYDFKNFILINEFNDDEKECLVEVFKSISKNYILDLSERYEKTSVSRKISSIRNFYKYLEKEKIIDVNHFENIKTPKKDSKLPNFLYEEEIEFLINSINTEKPLGKRNRALIEIMYATGIRVSELCNLKLRSIDLTENIIKVMGKGKKERIVPIHNIVRETIKDYVLNGRNDLLLNSRKMDEPTLFINYKGTPLTTRGVRVILKKILENCSEKFKISPHDIRHTFATHLLNNGADIRTVQELLGHDHLSSTQIYTNVSTEKLKEVFMQAHPRAKKK